jgi:hypothetical protein
MTKPNDEDEAKFEPHHYDWYITSGDLNNSMGRTAFDLI